MTTSYFFFGAAFLGFAAVFVVFGLGAFGFLIGDLADFFAFGDLGAFFAGASFLGAAAFLASVFSFFSAGLFFALLAAAFFGDFGFTALLLAAPVGFLAAAVFFLAPPSLPASLNEPDAPLPLV